MWRPQVPQCPECGHRDSRAVDDDLFACPECGTYFEAEVPVRRQENPRRLRRDDG